MDNLRIISFNCHSFSRNMGIINLLLDHCDILLLQETMITEITRNSLDKVSREFISFYTPAARDISGGAGRPSVGLAIFCRKSNLSFIPIYISQRIMGVNVSVDGRSYAILNVYCPCDYGVLDSLVEYKNTISEIASYCSDGFFDEIAIFGDFNCDPTKGRFFAEYVELASEFSLFMADINALPADTYTYIVGSQDA